MQEGRGPCDQCIERQIHTVEDGKLTMSEGKNKRRQVISVSNTVERLNKHPAVYVNYLKLIVESTCMLFTVDKEFDSTYSSSRDREEDYKIYSNIEC